MGSLIKNFFLAMGDDEDKWKKMWENVYNRTVFQLSDFIGQGKTIVPVGLMSFNPLLRQLATAIEGYDAEDLSLGALFNLVEAVAALMNKKSTLTSYGKMRNIATAFAQLYGVQLQTWATIFEGILEMFDVGPKRYRR
jgi:hypothetical protein